MRAANASVQQEREAFRMSTQEARASRFTRLLQNGRRTADGTCLGILAAVDARGCPLRPYTHQRQATQKALSTEVLVLAHDPGTGKTATSMVIHSAIELQVGGGACTIVTAPPSILMQWEQTAHTWLNVSDKKHAIVVCTVRSNPTKLHISQHF